VCGRDGFRAAPERALRCFFALCARRAFAPFAPAGVDDAMPAAIAAVWPSLPVADGAPSALGSVGVASAYAATGVVEDPGVLTVGVVT
jgi:hypothetical protein